MRMRSGSLALIISLRRARNAAFAGRRLRGDARDADQCRQPPGPAEMRECVGAGCRRSEAGRRGRRPIEQVLGRARSADQAHGNGGVGERRETRARRRHPVSPGASPMPAGATSALSAPAPAAAQPLLAGARRPGTEHGSGNGAGQQQAARRCEWHRHQQEPRVTRTLDDFILAAAQNRRKYGRSGNGLAAAHRTHGRQQQRCVRG